MQVEFNRLRAFQSFDTIDDLNRSIRAFLYRHKHALSENAIRLYRLLAQHSVKIPGVSFASTSYMADKLGVTRRTVFRLLKRLEALGAIERKALHREDGGRAQSAIIILPYVSQGAVIGVASQGATDDKPQDKR
ncbi:MAG: helix-turn-helix domain-containing protein, partial [Bacillales bacterium]